MGRGPRADGGESGHLLGHDIFDLAGIGEAAEGFLRVEQLAVEGDLEDTVPALDQTGFDSEAFFERVRQTGGSGFVVSNHTVFDRQIGHSILHSTGF